MQLILNNDDKNYLTSRSKQEIVVEINAILKAYGYKSPRIYLADMYDNVKYVWSIERYNLEEDSITKESKTTWEDEEREQDIDSETEEE